MVDTEQIEWLDGPLPLFLLVFKAGSTLVELGHVVFGLKNSM